MCPVRSPSESPYIKIRVHHDAGIAERATHARHLSIGERLLHELEQSIDATSSPPLTATQPAAASRRQQLGREGFLETNVAPPRDAEFLVDEALCECTHACRWRGPRDQVEARLVRLRGSALECAA